MAFRHDGQRVGGANLVAQGVQARGHCGHLQKPVDTASLSGLSAPGETGFLDVGQGVRGANTANTRSFGPKVSMVEMGLQCEKLGHAAFCVHVGKIYLKTVRPRLAKTARRKELLDAICAHIDGDGLDVIADTGCREDAMLELLLIVFGVSALVAFLAGKLGYGMGAKHAAAEIADFFRHEIKSSDNDLKSIPALLARRSMLADGTLRQIANTLYFATWNEGMAKQGHFRQPKTEDSQITMNRAELEDVSWLADTGLGVWISSADQPLRYGERLTYEKAKALANVLGTFERKIAFGFTRETEDEKERRFTMSLNRMQRVWSAYGKL